ncbi:MAG TPA: hypothetical protein VNK95_00105 [Caldilineaceae bacterium]|nr:hypothetical protein [Caldilineaceae bacterium]
MAKQALAPRTVNGPAAAALLASAMGCAVIGLMTTGAVISEGLKNALNWYNPAGPLSGKTGIGVIVWLVVWAFLHSRWKDKEVDLRRIYLWTLVLLAVGLVLTFPPVFEAFE